MLAALALVASLAGGPQEPRLCRGNPAQTGPCFELEGRAFVTNGTPSIRILKAGPRRLLGVLPAEAELAPRCFLESVSWERAVVGRFTVCPLSVEKPGRMQMVCVEAVTGEVVAAGGKRLRRLARCELSASR